jgi:hypothetical protein
MNESLLYIISIFGAITLIGVFIKMKPGIGVYNLRAVGIILIATFSCLLALNEPKILSAAMGILGAIAGYLFGAVETKKPESSSVSANESSFGDNTKMAGRDINETIENIEGSISKIENAIINQSESNIGDVPVNDLLIHTIYQRGEKIQEALSKTINQRQSEGWLFSKFSSDYQGMDGIFLIFKKVSSSNKSEVIYHHGSI